MPDLFASPIVTARLYSGINAASILAGLTALSGENFGSLQELSKEKFPTIGGSVALQKCSVHGIAGYTVVADFSKEGHVHRSLPDIQAIYEESTLSKPARVIARKIWSVIAQAEARVHDADAHDVHFHEVGRLANIVSIGLIGELFAALQPQSFVVSPIPLADGIIGCAHGLVPAPAPALLAMLDGVAVTSFAASGEPITPTGLGILLGLEAQFGSWPDMTVDHHATSFAPHTVFDDAPNGILWALGYSRS